MNALGTYFVDEEVQCTGVVVIVILFLGEKQNQIFLACSGFKKFSSVSTFQDIQTLCKAILYVILL
jgi:hypothetical protein